MKNMIFKAYDECGNEYVFNKREYGNSVFLTLDKNKFRNAKQLFALGNFTEAAVGENGYYITPRNRQSNGDSMTKFISRQNATQSLSDVIMMFAGVKTERFCAIIRPERIYRNTSFLVKAENGRYTLEVKYDFDDIMSDRIYDDIRIEIVFLPTNADYNDMANAERTIRLERGEIITLAEKCRSDAVEYNRKYPIIRIRLGWKPSPSPVKHQTDENEPEMKVACSFAGVRKIADALKQRGVEGAELQLVGWSIGGHDGRFPQFFPVEEKLGGEEELRKTISYVKTLGYRISLHTNNIDGYELSELFSFDDVGINGDGNYNQLGDYSSDYAYRLCPKCQIKHLERDLPELKSLDTNGLHFIDVVSIIPPHVCYSSDHPSSTRDSILYSELLMKRAKETLGGFSSEGCMDFAVKYLDYGLYVTFGDAFGKTELPLCDKMIPMWELIYHGTMLYNPRSETINYPIKPPIAKLISVMYGGKPSFYFYSKFKSTVNWMGEADFTADNDSDLATAVEHIYVNSREYLALADKQLLFMKRYDFLGDGLECATYEDGSRIVGNFSDVRKTFEGRTLEPYGYAVLEKR